MAGGAGDLQGALPMGVAKAAATGNRVIATAGDAASWRAAAALWSGGGRFVLQFHHAYSQRLELAN